MSVIIIFCIVLFYIFYLLFLFIYSFELYLVLCNLLVGYYISIFLVIYIFSWNLKSYHYYKLTKNRLLEVVNKAIVLYGTAVPQFRAKFAAFHTCRCCGALAS